MSKNKKRISKKELFRSGLEPILLKILEDSIHESESLEAVEQLKYLIKDRIHFVSNNNEVLKLILMESQINPEVIGFDYIKKILSILEDTIIQTGIQLDNTALASRLLMGSILSFLYFPEIDSEKIDHYINNLVQLLFDPNKNRGDINE